MPRLIRPFDPNIGPVVSVVISDPLSERAEFDSPRTQRATMLIDTGASDSSIANHIVERLGLRVTGFDNIHSWSGQNASLQYIADLELELDAPYELRDWPIFRFESKYTAVQGLIGRDILQHARFTLDGPRRQFTLEF